MTLRERVARARATARWNQEDENDAAIAEVFKFAGRLAVQGSEHDPAVGIRIAFVYALKRKAGEKP